MKHNFVIGNTTGKLGNIVAYVRGGEQFARAYQPVVLNPRTPRQQMSREKLLMASQLSRSMSVPIRVGFGQEANGRVSARNIFTSKLIKSDVLVGQTPATLEIMYEELQISDGKAGVYPFNMEESNFTTPLQVGFKIDSNFDPWEASHTSDGNSVDVALYLVVYNKSLGGCVFHTLFVKHKDSATWLIPDTAITVDVPGNWQGSYCETFAFTKQLPEALNGIAPDTLPYRYPGNSSKTQYCGAGRIA